MEEKTKNELRKKQRAVNTSLLASIYFLLSFIAWTVLVTCVDVKDIGPNKSQVGLSTLNGFFHSLTGCSMVLYEITDWLGLVPIFVAFCFGIFGLVQWIKRKSLLKVDFDILALGGFYIIVICVYILFEFTTINFRPVLINGYLEKSYPSSTTMLVMCVMITLVMQINRRIKSTSIKLCLDFLVIAFTVFMVIGRLISGVHWISDIIGGALLSTGLVALYRGIIKSI